MQGISRGHGTAESDGRWRFLLLAVIMACAAVAAASTSTYMLYRAALDREGARLGALADAQARLIDGLAGEGSMDPARVAAMFGGPAASSSPVDLQLVWRQADAFVFQGGASEGGAPVVAPPAPLAAEIARVALEGTRGITRGPDRRGVDSLFGYAPIAGARAAVVARLGVSEIRAPYIRFGALGAFGAFLIMAAGAMLIRRVDLPLVARLERSVAELSESERVGRMGGWRLRRTEKAIEWSNETFRIFGRSPDSFTPTIESVLECIHPDDRETARQRFTQAIANAKPARFSHRIVRPDGTVRTVRELFDVVADERGQAIGLRGTVQDITDLVRAEQALKDSEERFRDFAGAASDWLWETDAGHRFTFLSDPPSSPLVETVGAMIGKTRFDLRAPGDDDAAWRAHQADLDARRPFRNFEYELAAADGARHRTRISGRALFSPDGEFLGYRGVASDITAEVEARDAAATARARLMDALESIPEGFALFDADDRLVLTNRRFEELYGDHARPFAPGTPFEDIARMSAELGAIPEARGREAAWLRERLAQHRDPPSRTERQLDDGRWIVISEYRSSDGGTLMLHTDITEIKRREAQIRALNADLEHRVAERTERLAEELAERERAEAASRQSEKRLGSVMESVVDGIIVIDQDGIIESFNPAAERIFGIAAAEAIGANVSLLMPPPDRDRHDGYVATYRATGTATIIGYGREVTGRRKDGSVFPLELAISKVDIEGKVCFTGIVRDISTRKREERELVRARDDADAANRAKTEFLSRMSHELRTPLNAVLGFGQVLESDSDEPLSESQAMAVSQILTSGEHLLFLINEILDLTQLESGGIALSPTPIEPREVIDQCLAMIEAPRADRGIGLDDRSAARALPPVMADFTRLKQVLLVLLSNAVKYNRDGGRITLDGVVTGDGRLRISVADTGPGIAADQRAALFRPFSRLSHSRDGAGVGLALAKRLIELMGGDIGCDSVVGAGSTFWIEAPLAEPVATSTADPAQGAAAPVDRRILYVEDNPANRRLVERVVARVPHLDLITADTAERGLALIEAERPDLILMDLSLPGMDGFEALRRLRQSPATARLPVVALSAKAMPSDIEAGLAAGFDGYITKPVQIDQLLGTIDTVLARRAAEARPPTPS